MINNQETSLKKIKSFYPTNFKEERNTVWSFKQRGNWATHNGKYRGNWSPYIPRNVILKYSNIGDLVLDYFCGSGTTAVECKLLGRKCIAIDINDEAIELIKKNLNFIIELDKKDNFEIYEPHVIKGDARDLSLLDNESIDLICAHPPYSNIIKYSNSIEGDLSLYNINEFLKEMDKVAKESFRVLKSGKKCAILIGDTRRKKHIIPLGFKLIDVYLNAGFKLKELIIKRQHNCKTTGFWYNNSIKYNFLLLAHEYLPIFEKPALPISSDIEEKDINHEINISTLNISLEKKEIDKIETTTVWVLPEKDFEEELNKNVINRYSNEKNYSVLTLTSNSDNKIISTEKNIENNIELLFIKSPFLNDNMSLLDIENYLNKIKEIINHKLSEINNGGFLIIQTQDVRINGYIEPIAKKCIDMLTVDNLWLKEIIVITPNDNNLNDNNLKDCLGIIHQYLIVYEKNIKPDTFI